MSSLVRSIPTASQISNTPAGGIEAVTIQTALNELDTKKIAVVNLATAGGALFVGANDYQTQDAVNQERVSVKKNGALADGTALENNAFVLTQTNMPIGTAYVPSGTYKATSIKLKNKYTLQGDGIEVTTLKVDGAATLITSDLTNNSYCGLSRMTIKGDGADVTVGQKLLDVTGAYASYFNEVFFSSAPNLIELKEVEGQTVFRDCYFTNASKNDAGCAVRLSNVSDITFENTPIEDCSNGVYATSTNSVPHLKFKNVHSEHVGRLFNIDTNKNLGTVEFSDIVAINTGANLADPKTGYVVRVNNEMAKINNLHATMASADTPVVTTPLWSIYAKDCPSFTGADAVSALIPSLEIGLHNAYIPSTKRSLLDATLTPASMYTAANGAVVSVANGYAEFSGQGQYRIRPLTTSDIANRAVMLRFEYQSITENAVAMGIDGMGEAVICYSGSTATRAVNKIVLPSTAGVWKKVYVYFRATAEFAQASRFYYLNATNTNYLLKVKKLDIFECSRPPYSIMDW